MGFLATGNVFTRRRNSKARDFIVVSAEEMLGFGWDMSHNDGRAKRKDNMFIIRMKQ